MKKFFFSVITTVAVLLSSCSNNANDMPETASGSFVFSVDFADAGTQTRAAASSNAIPITSWGKIKKMWMFLYDKTTGAIAYAYELDPATAAIDGTGRKFPFSNIPSGDYRLAVVANVNHNTDNIATSMDGGTNWAQFENYLLRGRKMNDQVKIALKPMDLPTGHDFFGGSANGFATPSEIFVGYSDVAIVAGQTTSMADPLKLTREVSLMRVRLNKNVTYLEGVEFNNLKSFVAVQNNPQGLGLKLGSFGGGIFESVASDPNRILIGASGVATFKTENPSSEDYSTSSGTGTPTVLDNDFTLWQDIIVLPNAARSEQKAASDDASLSRKYTIIISAWAPAGYELSDGSKKTDAGPVYWSGVINEVFLQNNIREVNLTFKSRGSHEIPVYVEEGGLEVRVNAPEPWNSVIQRTDKEI